MDRLKQFVEKVGLPAEQARSMVEPLAGLSDKDYGEHVSYLAERKHLFKQGMPLASAAVPPTSPAAKDSKTRAEVVEYMSELLDAEIDDEQVPRRADALLLVDRDLEGVGSDIADYFAAIEREDEVGE